MTRVLHIVVEPGDPLAAGIISEQKADLNLEVRVVSLGAQPDYCGLLEEIFSADSVTVW